MVAESGVPGFPYMLSPAKAVPYGQSLRIRVLGWTDGRGYCPPDPSSGMDRWTRVRAAARARYYLHAENQCRGVSATLRVAGCCPARGCGGLANSITSHCCSLCYMAHRCVRTAALVARAVSLDGTAMPILASLLSICCSKMILIAGSSPGLDRQALTVGARS